MTFVSVCCHKELTWGLSADLLFNNKHYFGNK